MTTNVTENNMHFRYRDCYNYRNGWIQCVIGWCKEENKFYAHVENKRYGPFTSRAKAEQAIRDHNLLRA